MYPRLIRYLRRLNPEFTHHAGVALLQAFGLPGVRALLERGYIDNPRLSRQLMGLHFAHPFGLAAGFDKDAEIIAGLGAVGFGHVEVGTVTPRAQPGNPAPRLFRLPEDQALINRMGFNNRGVESMLDNLHRARSAKRRPVIGVNIGKNRDTPLERAEDDYGVLTQKLSPVADYLVVNVSSPNTPGLRALQDPSILDRLLAVVQQESGATPVLVKVSPDSPDEEIADIAVLVTQRGLAGLVATNTTVAREGLSTPAPRVAAMGAGGLSGAPLQARSEQVLRVARKALGAGPCLISVGGVSTGAQMRSRLDAGADLVQAYTSFVYRGPFVARHIIRELLAEMA
ncbi:MAG: quinone-dependent dihydroorotate dehydrogenase [Pontimonas sp.]